MAYKPLQPLDTSGFLYSLLGLRRWQDPTSLEQIRESYDKVGYRNIQ